MTSRKLDHIAIAVENLEEAMRFYVDQLGLKLQGLEVVSDQGVRVAKLELGDAHIDLLEPLAPDTPVGKFLHQRGPGLHHIAISVQDIEADLSKLKASRVRLIDETAKIGAGGARIAFIHPKSTGGVLVELSEPS